MFNTISFEKLLEVTAEDLAVIKDNLETVYMNETISKDVQCAALADAFSKIEYWTSYFNKFKEIQDSKLDELNRENISLVSENNRLKNENKVLSAKNKELSEKNSKIVAQVEYLEQVLTYKDNSSNMVQVDLVNMVETLEKALNIIEENSSKIINSKRVNSGNFKPAMRIDVDNETVAKQYLSGATPNTIAKQYGMTQSAIIYRLKKMGIYVEGGRK